MSKISEIYDAIDSLITTALPSHRQLNNPYFPENDSELSYDSAYGLAFAEGLNEQQETRQSADVRGRDFIITLTKRKFAKARDKDKRILTEKALMEDHATLLNKIAESSRLGNPSLVQRFTYTTDGGVEFLSLGSNQKQIMLIRTVVNVVYEEEILFNAC